MIATLLALTLAQDAPHVAESDHYEVRSDVGGDLCRRVAGRLERAHAVYAKLLPYPPPGAPRFKVRVYSTRERRDEHGRSLQRPPKESFYYVHDPAREVLAYVLPDAPFFARLTHECFHQYFRRIVDEPPQWVNEGLAEYLEAGAIADDGTLRPAVSRGFVRRWREGIRSLDTGVLNGRYRFIAVRDVMAASKEQWLRREGPAYCESWGLVYYALDGGDAKLRDRFTAYLKALAKGTSREENTRRALESAFGDADFEALEKSFVEFMDRLEVPGHAAFREGEKLSEEGRHEEALAKFTEALGKDPGNDRAWYFRGREHYSMEQYERAEPDLRKAVELFPEYTTAHFVLGRTCALLRKFDAARASLDRTLQLDPKMKKAVDEWRAKIDALERGEK